MNGEKADADDLALQADGVLSGCCSINVRKAADSGFCWFWTQTNNEVACQLEAEPAAGHARSDLEQIRCNSFVEALDAFLRHNDTNGIPDALVLVAHA